MSVEDLELELDFLRTEAFWILVAATGSGGIGVIVLDVFATLSDGGITALLVFLVGIVGGALLRIRELQEDRRDDDLEPDGGGWAERYRRIG